MDGTGGEVIVERGTGSFCAPDQLEAVVYRSKTRIEWREGTGFLLPAREVQTVGLSQSSYSRKRQTPFRDVRDRDTTLRS
jgi:hypothetical protein